MKREDGLPRNPRIKYRFRAKPFDFMFQWMVGSSTNGGAEIGEVMYAASRIPDGDGEAWYREFAALGTRAAERAVVSASTGHAVSAREAFLRAYVYHRAAPLFLNPRTDERYPAAYETARSLFRRGAELFDPPLEPIEIPYHSAALPGYIALPTDGSDPRHAPTLLMIGGGDTFVEDLYYYIVPAAGRRGYRVVFVDLPGQGGLPWIGLPMEAQAERPVGAVIDELERRSDIDLSQLVVYGISGGGYLAPRAAAHDPRIKALVACSVILDIEAVWSRRLLRLSSSLLGVFLRVVYPKLFRAIMNLVDTYRWRWGARTNQELLQASEPFKIEPASIRCPTLNLVAQQEYEDFGSSRRWAQRCQDEIANEHRRLVVTPRAEGADAHAIGTNLSLMSQIVFDWLDEVLDRH